ncbi:hypothetical protein [Klebsiella sp. CN_Kp116]|uniref:fimbrial protein n=1 Tax=unclassified Klebsiella TaxID=2608929 RepID=UPI0032B3B0DF
MSKFVITISPLLTALLIAPGISYSASNAQMTITSNVVASTCDVSVSNTNLDLGNFNKSAFQAVGVAKPITSSIKNFTVGLSNCETPTAGGVARLKVTGQTLAGNSNIFNSTGTNTGIMLNLKDQANVYINAGDKLDIATAGDTPTSGDFNGKTLSLQAGLASSSTTPDIGEINAPVLFSFIYN